MILEGSEGLAGQHGLLSASPAVLCMLLEIFFEIDVPSDSSPKIRMNALRCTLRAQEASPGSLQRSLECQTWKLPLSCYARFQSLYASVETISKASN